jgi:hypothetical protein
MSNFGNWAWKPPRGVENMIAKGRKRQREKLLEQVNAYEQARARVDRAQADTK